MYREENKCDESDSDIEIIIDDSLKKFIFIFYNKKNDSIDC